MPEPCRWIASPADLAAQAPQAAEPALRAFCALLWGDGSVYHLLLYKDARDDRHAWRVDGRVHDEGRGAVQARPFPIQPCNESAHLHNDADAEGKLAQPVYRKPSPLARMRQFLHTVTRVRHQ